MNSDRCQVEGSQGRMQSGSDDRVLENLLGISDAVDMDELELRLLTQLYDVLLIMDLPDRQLSVDDLKSWHRQWLGNVYDWAGAERSVNMGKDGFMFASVAQLPRLLQVFERDCLAHYTPCHGLMSREALVEAIAITHVEMILIHPFREGNGRLSRLLAAVMAVQACREPLDYSSWDADKASYIAAIHHGVSGNYQPIKELVSQALSDRRLT